MKKRMLCWLTGLIFGCSAAADVHFGVRSDEDVNKYWYTDGAEISRYELTQARYGELHKGDAILLFVTETFRSDLQVKADDPSAANLPVLKLNAQRKFYTGVYPYSVMTSVFSSVADGEQTFPVKVTMSAQEWCGHVYVQMNLRGERYEVKSFSYFASEGDHKTSMMRDYSEDGLFNLVRLAPEKLPIGEFNLIPGTLYTRMMHIPLKASPAVGKLSGVDGENAEKWISYTVEVPSHQRTLTLTFERDFPHRIERWKDTYPSLPFAGSKMLTTEAVRTHTVKSRYWERNRNKDRVLLEELGLTAP